MTKDETIIGSYPVKIESTVMGVKSARSIDFMANMRLEKCIDGDMSPLNSIEDFTYEPIEKQISYEQKIIGTQEFSLNKIETKACAVDVRYIVQVQMLPSKEWVGFS